MIEVLTDEQLAARLARLEEKRLLFRRFLRDRVLLRMVEEDIREVEVEQQRRTT